MEPTDDDLIEVQLLAGDRLTFDDGTSYIVTLSHKARMPRPVRTMLMLPPELFPSFGENQAED